MFYSAFRFFLSSIFSVVLRGRCIGVLILVLFLSGCSSNDRLGVSGTIAVNGKPIESGAISFRPAPGNSGSSSGGQIRQGRFQLTAQRGLVPGKYLVAVQAFQPTGRTIKDGQSGQMVAEQAEVKYNEAGKLEATVTAGKENQFDFQLTGMNPRRSY